MQEFVIISGSDSLGLAHALLNSGTAHFFIKPTRRQLGQENEKIWRISVTIKSIQEKVVNRLVAFVIKGEIITKEAEESGNIEKLISYTATYNPGVSRTVQSWRLKVKLDKNAPFPV